MRSRSRNWIKRAVLVLVALIGLTLSLAAAAADAMSTLFGRLAALIMSSMYVV